MFELFPTLSREMRSLVYQFSSLSDLASLSQTSLQYRNEIYSEPNSVWQSIFCRSTEEWIGGEPKTKEGKPGWAERAKELRAYSLNFWNQGHKINEIEHHVALAVRLYQNLFVNEALYEFSLLGKSGKGGLKNVQISVLGSHASILLKLHRYERAKALICKALELDPDHVRSHRIAGDLAVERNEWLGEEPEWRRHYRKVKPLNPDAYFSWRDAELKLATMDFLNEPPLMETACDRVREQRFLNSDFHKATEICEEEIRNATTPLSADFYFHFASNLLDHRRCIQRFGRYHPMVMRPVHLANDPASVPTREEILEQFERAHEVNPYNLRYLLKWISVLYELNIQTEKIQGLGQKIVQLNPHSPEGWLFREEPPLKTEARYGEQKLKSAKGWIDLDVSSDFRTWKIDNQVGIPSYIADDEKTWIRIFEYETVQVKDPLIFYQKLISKWKRNGVFQRPYFHIFEESPNDCFVKVWALQPGKNWFYLTRLFKRGDRVVMVECKMTGDFKIIKEETPRMLQILRNIKWANIKWAEVERNHEIW